MRPGESGPDGPSGSNTDEPPPEGAGGGAAGGSSGASSPAPPGAPDDEPSQGSGQIEMPLGVPTSPEEYRRLKQAARQHDQTPEEGTPEEAESDPGAVDPDSEDEGEELGDG